METCIESPKALGPYGRRTAAAQPVELSRLVLPMLYAIMGISLGTLAGASIALSTESGGNSMVYYNPTPTSAPASPTLSEAAAVPMVNSAPVQSLVNSAPVQSFVNSAPAPIQNALSAVLVRTGAESVNPSVAVGHSTTNPTASGILHTHHVVKARRSPASQIVPSKAPAAERRPEFRFTPEEHPSKPVAHPVTKPVRTLLASEPPASVEPFEAQPSLSENAVSSIFYTEGDLQVASYDASTDTIQSIDGRTFTIGSTVSLSTATPWSDYHANVHYRCASDGSCTLVRPGVVASNARLI
jgi:hypothetical protein